MLYLHCGWPHTGTSSLQAALGENRDRLATGGVLYPDLGGGRAQHRVLDLLQPEALHDGSWERFREYLRANAERAILISSEGLSGWFEDGRRPALLDLLRFLGEVVPITCVLTLRRADELLASRYNHRLLIEQPAPPPTAFSLSATQWHVVRGFGRWLTGVAAVPEVSAAVGDSFAFCEYDELGAHDDAILRTVGLAEPACAAMAEEVRRGVRLNARLTRKAVVALLHLDEIAARVGKPLSRRDLVIAWRMGRLRFDADAPCDLLGEEVRCEAHERALETSREAGLDPYTRLLERVEIEPSAPTSLDPDILTDDDVEHLVALAGARQASGSPR